MGKPKAKKTNARKGYQTLELTQDGRGVLTVMLNRPDVRNAFNEELIAELTEVFTKQAASPQVRAVVLRGMGKVFCAGGDLNWMKRAASLSYQENLKDTRLLSQLFHKINEFPKPVIGAVHGAAIGGGVGLVSVCDIVIALETCVFSLSEVRLGIVPACIGPFVISKIGASHARELFLSSLRFEAKKAQRIGLIHYVATDELGLNHMLEEVLFNVLHGAPGAVARAKELVLKLSSPEKRAKLGGPEKILEYISKTLAELRVAPEGQAGVKAFLEKKDPPWIQNAKSKKPS